MKLEKREITLNEADSLRDMLVFEKVLLHAYVLRSEKAERKEVRAKLTDFITETMQSTYVVADLLKKSLGNCD